VLFVGRIQAYKGAARLLEALHALPDILLIIAGDGPDFGALRATVGSHVARDRVRVLGGVTDETRRLLLAAANLVCLPSRNEGLPLSLLEAMAMGTPVATTRPWLPRELHPFANFGEDPVRLVRDGLALSEGLDPRRVRAAIMGRFTWDHIGSAYATLFGRVWSMGR
jgi:glycosyltransferase involved in cell wall biosynthesis